MPGWAKGLLIILAVVFALVIGAIVAGVIYVAHNKDAWRAKAREAVAEGRDFGSHSDNQGCVDETMSRYKREPGFFSALKYQGFMDGCLEKSSPTSGFCDNIPLGDMMKMVAWRDGQCRRYDLANDRNCQQLFMPVMMFCGEKKRNQSKSQ